MPLFSKKNNNHEKVAPAVESVNVKKEKVVAMQIKDENIHVIPARFYNVGVQARKKLMPQQKMFILSISIFIVTLIAIGIAGFIFFTKMSQPPRVAVNVNKIEDRNENENVSKNENVNENENVNVNENINENKNENVNDNENKNEDININENTNIQKPLIRKFTSSLDSDKDLLTDMEEMIYNTDRLSSDTDGDGYTDGHELFYLYNPVGEENRKVLGSFIIDSYTDNIYKYKVFRPGIWLLQVKDLTHKEVTFLPEVESKEFIRVRVEENVNKLSLHDWVAESLSVKGAQLRTIYTKEKMRGIMSPGKLDVYFISKDNNFIFIISYEIGELTEVNYYRTFEMMYRSFRFIK